VARWHVDDQSFGVAGGERRQFVRQEPDIVLDREVDARLYLVERARDEGQEVLVQNGDKKVAIAIWHFGLPRRG
jgi:hypothetical protein